MKLEVKVWVGAGVLAAALVFAAGRSSAPEAVHIPVPGPTTTVTKTVTKTVTESVPAKLPKVCVEAFDLLTKFQADVSAMDGAAGTIKLKVSSLQIAAAFNDAAAMTPLIEELNASVNVMDDAAIESQSQYSSINVLAVQCQDAIAEP